MTNLLWVTYGFLAVGVVATVISVVIVVPEYLNWRSFLNSPMSYKRKINP